MNACGKTTLARCLIGKLKPAAGGSVVYHHRPTADAASADGASAAAGTTSASDAAAAAGSSFGGLAGWHVAAAAAAVMLAVAAGAAQQGHEVPGMAAGAGAIVLLVILRTTAPSPNAHWRIAAAADPKTAVHQGAALALRRWGGEVSRPLDASSTRAVDSDASELRKLQVARANAEGCRSVDRRVHFSGCFNRKGERVPAV